MNEKIKVKIFYDIYGYNTGKGITKTTLAEDQLNDFIENNKIRVVDIKLQTKGEDDRDTMLMLMYTELPDYGTL